MLFSLAMSESSKPRQLLENSMLPKARIIVSAATDKSRWLFMESAVSGPFAIETGTGRLSKFTIPGLKIPGDGTPAIQSHVVVPHVGGIVLMVAGGDRGTWPRDGNRPVYFWMSLRTGEVVRFPSGWDLEYFSKDQAIAVFAKPSPEPFQRRPLQAIDMETGDRVDGIPNRSSEGYVPFDWWVRQRVKPLRTQTEGGDRTDRFAGLTVNGHVLRLDLPLGQLSHLSQAHVEDGFVGFRLRRAGGSGHRPSPFWLAKLQDATSPAQVADGVTDFALLGDGNCIYVTAGHGTRKESCEAFFYARRDKSAWNVLDGVQRLPELTSELAGKNYIADRMTVRLVEGFGSPSPVVLCLFEHSRSDARAFALPGEGPAIEPKIWRRAVLVTSGGERYLADLFPHGQRPDRLWLHNSGRLILGTTEQGTVQLSEPRLRLMEASSPDEAAESGQGNLPPESPGSLPM